MLSKMNWLRVLAAGCLLMSSACGVVKVGEGPLPESVAKLGGADLNCLSTSNVVVQDYVEGRGTEEQVNSLAHCATRSLQIFGELTRGSQRGTYSAAELRTFLQRYFLGNLNLTKSFFAEAMLIKRTVLGGNEKELTLKDLDHTIEIIEIFRVQALKLRRHMPINTARLASSSPGEIDAVCDALMDVAQTLGVMIEATNSPYTLNQLDRMLGEVGTLFPQAETPSLLREKLALAGTIKALVLSTSSEEIAPYDWPLIFTEAVKLYRVYLHYRHLDVTYTSWSYGAGRMQLMRVVYGAKDLLSDSVSRHGGLITFDEIDNVLDLVSFAPLGLNKETFKGFLRPLVRHALGAIDRTDYDSKDVNGISVALLDRMLGFFYQWSEGQRYLEGVYAILDRGHRNPDPRGYGPDELNSISIEAALADTGGVTRVGLEMANDLREVIEKNQPLFRGEGKEITFSGPNEERQLSRHNLSEVNWMRQAARVLISGYAKSPQKRRDYGGITFPEFKIFAADIWNVAVDIKLVDPKNDQNVEAERRFREANLFTPSANGDEMISLDEGSQLLAFLISAKRLAVRMHEFAASHCQTAEELDYFGQARIEPDCYRRIMFNRIPGKSNYEEIWKFMPGMADFFFKLSNEKAVQDFDFNLEEAARRKGYSRDRYMESPDSEGFALIYHYVEAIFSRFDADFEGSIDYPESGEAFPRFKRTLTEVSGFGKCRPADDRVVAEKVEALFTYLLAHGEPPVAASDKGLKLLAGGAKFWAWRQKKIFGGWHFKATRMTLVKVLSQIGKLTAPAQPTPGGSPVPTITTDEASACPGYDSNP
ncbi:MAG: hypothetical protein H7222_06880 [Methylotenera sp.]|nr:hypothetical protein [Oligoflexia bacterium]